MSKLKIEEGKFYRTRDGQKARIYATDGGYDERYHGAILCDMGWFSTTWAEHGAWWSIDGAVHDYDIVAEWTDKHEN